MFAEFCAHEVVGVVYSKCQEGYAFTGGSRVFGCGHFFFLTGGGEAGR